MKPRRNVRIRNCWAMALAAFLPLVAAAQVPQQLTLQGALDLMAQHQPTLRLAETQIGASQAYLGVARSPWLPQVSLALAYTRQTGNFAGSPGAVPSSATGASEFSWNTYNFWSGQLSLQQLIWDFGAAWNRIDAAKASLEATKVSARTARVTATLNVRTAYASAAGSRDLVKVSAATLENMRAHLRQVEGFVGAGTRPELDLAQSKADLAAAKLAMVRARNNYALAKARLNLAMGVEAATTYDVVEGTLPEVPEERLALESVVETALAERPEIRNLDAQMRAQEFARKSAWTTYWPTLSANANLSARGRELTALVPNVAVGASLNWALFQGGAVQAEVAQAEAQLAQLFAQKEIARLQVRLDVEQAMLSIGAAKEERESADEAAEAAKEQLRLAEARYATGVGSVIEWMDAQTNVSTAAGAQATAQFNLASSRAALLAAIGR